MARLAASQEREAILAWGRATSILRENLQKYRFECRSGSCSRMAHRAAARLIEKRHPSIGDPMNYAGAMYCDSKRARASVVQSGHG